VRKANTVARESHHEGENFGGETLNGESVKKAGNQKAEHFAMQSNGRNKESHPGKKKKPDR